jgi:hypothetical protein
MGLGSMLGFGKKRRTRPEPMPLPEHGPPYTQAELQRLGSRPRGNNPIIGQAISRREAAKRKADTAVQDTQPPDAAKSASANIGDAYGAAERTRRRARAGNAGRVMLPGGPGGPNIGTPRTLVGF